MKKEKLEIIYEDKDIIIVNKKSGLLTISTDKVKDNTLYHKVSEYLKKQNKNNKVFIVHRLDKDTQGLVIFAKSEKVKRILQDNWANVKRDYLAIVYGHLGKKKDTLVSHLKETRTHLVYESKVGDLAITNYEVIKENKLYSLLKINIETGKKNQIRVQLKGLNHPIVGDKVYSDIKNKNVKELCLQAYALEFKHPISKELIKVSLDYPASFQKLISK